MTSPFRHFRLPVTRLILWCTAGILAVLLFVGGPGYHSPRSLNAAWDLGHIFAFSLWSYLLLTGKTVREASPSRRWLTVLLFCLVVGGATEGLQSFFGGDASLGDLFRDVVGGVFTLSLYAFSRNTISPGMRRTMKGLLASIVLIVFLPLGIALVDEGIARAQFPLLSDFETPFEKNRLEVFNPSPDGIQITCRIHDRRHEEGEQLYEDRFNKGFLIHPGWNDLRIDLNEVATAPMGRMMDLGEIRAVGFFASRLPAPRIIFLDYVRLE